MYLVSILGALTADMDATSVAMISFPTGVGPDALKPLVATKDIIDKYWDKRDGFKFKIGEPEKGGGKEDGKEKGDDQIDEGMWTSFKDPANDAKTVKDLMKDGNPTILQVDDNIYLPPGEKATLYGDKNMGQFINQTVVLPVVDPADLNPKDMAPIKDFIAFHITDYSQGGKYIEGYFDKDYVITNPQKGQGFPPYPYSTPSAPQLVN